MPAEWRIVPLDRKHDRSAFDCGEPALNDYLACYARQNQGSGIARTFVAVEDEVPDRILGYYSLTVGGMDKANLSPEAAKRFPNYPLPVARLVRLAVDLGARAQGLGEHLLMDALHRCLRVAREVGVVAVLVDAKDDKAKRFYARYEFESMPDQPLLLWLRMRAVSRLFAETNK